MINITLWTLSKETIIAIKIQFSNLKNACVFPFQGQSSIEFSSFQRKSKAMIAISVPPSLMSLLFCQGLPTHLYASAIMHPSDQSLIQGELHQHQEVLFDQGFQLRLSDFLKNIFHKYSKNSKTFLEKVVMNALSGILADFISDNSWSCHWYLRQMSSQFSNLLENFFFSDRLAYIIHRNSGFRSLQEALHNIILMSWLKFKIFD